MVDILREGFETDGNGTRYSTSVPEFSDGAADYFTRTDGTDIGDSIDVTGQTGAFWFAAMDIDGEGAALPVTLDFTGIDITGFTNLGFSVDLAEDDDGTNEDWDVPDFVHFAVRIDGGAYVDILNIESFPDGDDFNAVPAIDTDFDGDGDGTQITSAFQTFAASIAGTGSILDLRVTFNLNAGDEDIAIDEIAITGDSTGGGTPTLISEFRPNPEGGDPATSTFELSGTPGASFSGFITSIEGDAAGATIDRLAAVSGTFDPNGLLLVTVPDLENPSFTVVLSSDAPGTIGDDLDGNADGDIDNPSVFGTIYDAIGVPDAAGDAGFLYGNELGGTDFTFTGDEPRLIFRAGSVSSLYAINDPDNGEVYEVGGTNVGTAIFNLDPTAGSDTFGTVNPILGPAPTATFAIEPDNAVQNEGDAGTTDFTFTVTRAGDTSGAASVSYAVSGDADAADFGGTLPSGTVNFADGEATQTITIGVSGDTDVEPNETFTVTLFNPTGGVTIIDAVADGTIQDDDTVVVITPIYDIQGASQVSPFVLGSQTVVDFFATLPADTDNIDGGVVTTQGVVTAVDTNGFYMQDPTGDGDIGTSDGIFVAVSSPTVSVGDSVQVQGTVSEVFPGDTDTRNLPTTQLTNVTISTLPTSLGTVTPQIIGTSGRTPPDANIDDDAFAIYDPVNDGIDFFESLEGMLVTAEDLVVVNGTNQFGEIFAVANGGANASGVSSRGTLNISPDDFNPEKIQIDTDFTISGFSIPSVNVGDQLGDVTGVVGYGFGNFEIIPTVDFTSQVVDNGLTQETTALVGTGEKLTVASYNVLNLDPIVEDPALTDDGLDDVDDDVGDGRFAEIANQIVNNLNAPDIIGLQEVQDNTGAEINGVTAADVTLQTLIDAIVAAGGPTYSFIDNTFIGDETSGGQPGGNIRTAFLYNDARVTLDASSVQTIGGQGSGEAFEGARLPLVADFEFNGETVTVVNNHFSSKGGSAPILGIEQDFAARQEDVTVNGSLDERQTQSNAVQTFVSDKLTADANANVVVLGDLNEFEFISPVTDLESAGLTNLVNDIPDADERYSFIFQGNSQQLDHILVSDSLRNHAEIDIVHTNSEFVANDARASDHDPVVALLDFSPDVFTLELLHFTDQEANAATIDNIDNLSAVLNALRMEDLANDGVADNTLTLSSGDVIIPGLFFDASQAVFGSAGIADIQIQNELGLQAAALGNHEFDLGTAFLAGLIDGSAPGDFSALSGTALDGQDFQGALFPYLSANLGFSTDPNLAPLEVAGGQDTATLQNVVTSSSVSDVNGELIGIVGATVPTIDTISSAGSDIGIFPEDFDSNPTDTQLDALAAVIQLEVDALLAANPSLNKVVLLSHMQQISIELALAERLTDVDIIVAGGSNTRLFDDNDRIRAGDSDQGQYPLFVTNAGGTTTAVVNTDANYKYVGRLVIDFDADGNLIPGSYDETVSGAYATDDQGVADLGAEGLVDPEVDAITDAIQAQIVATESNVFGVSDVFLNGNRSGTFTADDPDGVRTQETNLGNLTADANLVYANQIIADQGLGDPVLVSIKNGGGIRANIGEIVVPAGGTEAERVPNSPVLDENGNVVKPEGGISQNDVQTVLAFNNGLTLLDITKAELKAFLEGAVSALPTGVSGGFPQISGLKFSFDETQTAQTYDASGNIATPGERVQNAGIFDENDQLIAEIVRDGQIVGDANETFRIVTLDFLADAGDEILSNLSNPNRVDLQDLDADGVEDGVVTGAATFADDGSEQDALAEYLNDNFNPDNGGVAYNEADTGPALDDRIQNLTFRQDTVLPEQSGKFTLQILHASDLEGGVDALDRAPNFAAIVDALEDQENTIILSAGDNYIPGPFFNAAGDRATFRDGGIFNDTYNTLFNTTEYDSLREGGGRVDISIMNVIGFDASAIGNHEFDNGSDAFETAIEEDFRDPAGPAGDRWVGAQFPYLSANLDFSGDGDLGNLFTSDILPNTAFATGPAESAAGNTGVPKIAQATTVDVNGEIIGVVGATTQLLQSISSPTGTVETTGGVNDMAALAAVLQPVIDAMTNDGINKIILVSHLQQIALETELAGLLDGVDVIIAGGSDTVLANPDDTLRPGDTANDTYPIVTTDANGDPTLIVSTNGEYSYVGQLTVDFDENGVLVGADGNPVDDVNDLDLTKNGPIATTDENVAAIWGSEDPFAEGTKGAEVEKLTDAVESVVIAQDGNVIGETDVYLNGERGSVRTEETNFGNLTADANLAAAQEFDSEVLVSLKNGGGIRAPIGEIDGTTGEPLPPQDNPLSGKLEGQISQLDIDNSLRFNNSLTLVTLTPEQLKQVLEHAVAATGPGNTPGQFAQVGGISYSFDASLPAGERVQNVAIVDEDGNFIKTIVTHGMVVSDEPIRVVTLNFLVGGGDGYPYPEFEAADPEFFNRVDLPDELSEPGDFDFAAPGTEQDALAEFLGDNHPIGGGTPFDDADTPVEEDTRIQNLEFRDDEVVDGFNRIQIGDDGRDRFFGSNFADLQIGEGGNDRLFGRGGDDVQKGGDGNDLLDGGRGDDWQFGGAGKDRIIGGLGDDFQSGGDGNDKLYGNFGDDTQKGGDGNDKLYGGFGNDLMLGGAGNDHLFGSLGNDTASFEDSQFGVHVELDRDRATTDTGSGIERDWLNSIENIIGSDFDDHIKGDRWKNKIDGGLGNDLISGAEGNDDLDGNQGIDTVDYSDRRGPVEVDLEAGTGSLMARSSNGGFWSWLSGDLDDIFDWFGGYRGRPKQETDKLSNFENVIGTDEDDVIYGDDGDNVLDGGKGDDGLFGRGGDDTLISGNSYDFLDGGEGIDTAVVSGNQEDFVFDQTDGVVTLTRVDNGHVTTIVNTEILKFDDVEIPVPPEATEEITLQFLGRATTSGAEIVAHDPGTQRMFVTTGDGLDVLDISDPTNPTFAFFIDVPAAIAGFTADSVTSVAVKDGIVAVAVSADPETDPGRVAFFDADGTFLNAVTVGSLPDMVTFTPDGMTVLVAIEGEADGGVDPEGSIDIIDISGGVGSATVTTADFTAFNGQEDALRDAGVRIFPGKTVAEDLEPEYIAVSPDGTTAFVTLQENNAVAVVDIATATVTDILPLGVKDHSLPGQGLDTSDRDNGIFIDTAPVVGMYMPDAIASYEADGQTYFVTANEGDARDEDERIEDLTLDPTAFPNAADLQQEGDLGRLQVSNIDGDTDGDGDFDELFAYGARSFSIWDDSGNLVYDSGDDFESIVATQLDPALFNDEGVAGDFDNRSDNKGPEPEGVVVGEIGDSTFAFVGLERVGGVMVYDITDPNSPDFVQYINTRADGDVAPEGLAFIAADDSPTGEALLAVSFEESSTVSLFQIDDDNLFA